MTTTWSDDVRMYRVRYYDPERCRNIKRRLQPEDLDTLVRLVEANNKKTGFQLYRVQLTEGGMVDDETMIDAWAEMERLEAAEV